jgi:hypothetical protein
VSDSPPDETSGRPALWRSLVPSLAILAGTFFFISAACFSDGSSDYYYEPCVAHSDTTAPAGSFVTIERPTPEEVFLARVDGSATDVPIVLRANGVEITAANECRPHTGHFKLAVRRLTSDGCPPLAALQPTELNLGETEAVYQLPPGSYELAASIVTGSGASYVPPLTDAVHFVVDGDPFSDDGGLCE